MITIRQPIRLKSNRSLGTLHDDMNEKIQGNYDLMTNSIRKEELLYLTTSTPEIYFAEGSATNILNEVTTQTQQNFRLDVINNLINRILVSNTDNFSYQDQVYISTALRKIGITDVNQFMQQVRRLQEDRRENHTLLQMYEKNENLLYNILQAQSTTEQKIEEITNLEETKEDWFLHEEIYKRLQTGDIYNEITQFVRNNFSNDQRISMQEMNVSEQSLLVDDFRLQELRQQIYQNLSPMTLYHNNIYETDQLDEETEEEVEERLSSAILLNLVNQVYGLRMEQIEENQHQWFQVAPALYNSAQNTWERVEYNQIGIQTSIAQTVNEMQEIWDGRRKEVKVLEEVTNRINRYQETTNVNRTEIEATMDQYYQNTDVDNEESTYIDLTESYPKTVEIRHVEEQLLSEPVDEGTASSEALIEQIRQINEKNVENVRQVQKIQRELPKIKDVRLDKKQARQMALRALEHPDEVLREVMEREIVTPQQDLITYAKEQIYEVLPEDTGEILREIQRDMNDAEGRKRDSIAETAELARHAADIFHTENSIIEQRREQIIHSQAEATVKTEPFKTVSFVHKEEEQIVEEDLLDLIEQKTTQTIQKNETITHNVINTNRVETQVQNQVNHISKEQIDNVEELVKQNVTKQLGRISDQVYGKIEKRLMTERKRRGF